MKSLNIKDQNDPSGFGMFSKAGRCTTEKHSNALLQFQSLFPEYKNNRASLPLRQKKRASYQPDQNYQIFQKRNHSSNFNNLEPFAKMVARSNMKKSIYKEKDSPPCGYYSPKDSYIKGAPKLVMKFRYSQSQNKNDISPMYQTSNTNITTPKKKIKGLVEYKRVISREQYHTIKVEVNEKRFENIHISEAWSRKPHIPSVSFEKYAGRKSRPQTSPDLTYSPKFQVVHKRLNLYCTPMVTQTPRKPNILNVNCLNDDVNYEFNLWSGNKSHIYSNTRKTQVKFDAMRGRENKNSRLPQFMQKTINNRLNLTILNEKMLEENSFIDQNLFYPPRKNKSFN